MQKGLRWSHPKVISTDVMAPLLWYHTDASVVPGGGGGGNPQVTGWSNGA